MATKESTGLRNYVCTEGSFADAFASCEIRVYSGEGGVPATADAAETGTLLNVYSANDTGATLSFEAAAVNGTLHKASAQVWSGTPIATGVPAYYRLVQKSDDGSSSTTFPRVQGVCGTGGADLNFSELSLTMGELHIINSYQYIIPTL